MEYWLILFNASEIKNSIELLVTNTSMRQELGNNARITAGREMGFKKLLDENIAFYKQLISE